MFSVAHADSGLWQDADKKTVIVKSDIDRKQYRYLELANNLKVILVSDPDSDMSAASLDVHIGSGSDPVEWQGLAHLLEHMLFLGTGKYPEAGEYQQFIKQHGGSNNAYTSFSHTNYFFNISAEFFEPALDRFSRFFIDPTFDELYVERERAVVHSEYQARRKDENRRLWDARKRWLNPRHPATQFSVGSLQTLRDRDSGSAREKLVEFYMQHYSANIMALAIVAPEPLDALEKLVREKFSAIPDRGVARQQFDMPYFDAGLIPARLDVIPETERNAVSFVFPVPTTIKEYDAKPLGYLANILGHEGPGSLFDYLKKRGWVESLSAGPAYMDHYNAAFNVDIGLTGEGLEHIEDIGHALFSVVDKIRQAGGEAWRYAEQARLAKISFDNARESDSGRLAQSLSARLQRYAPEHLLYGPYMLERFDPGRIMELLGYLRPDNVNIQIIGQNLVTDQTTRYYDVDYRLAKIAGETIARWSQTDDSLTAIFLPEPNPFIPDRLETGRHERAGLKPFRLDDTGHMEVWYAPDTGFHAPRASFYFTVMSPEAGNSARAVVATEIWVGMLNRQLADDTYPAYLADLGFRLYRHSRGITVKVNGFEDRQTRLLRLIVDALRGFDADGEAFVAVKDSYRRALMNVRKDPPSNQTIHEIYRLLTMPYWSEAERLAALDELTIDDVAMQGRRIFREVKATVLSHGDVTEAATRERADIVASLLSESDFVSTVEPPAMRRLTAPRYLREKAAQHNDSALSVFFQSRERTRAERARISLLRQLLESSFYTELRTRNQVGYLVYAGSIDIDRNRGLLLSVQSPSHSPYRVNALYDTFIVQFADVLDTMSEAQFESARQGLIARITEKDRTLGKRSDRYWREIDQGEFAFDTRQRLVDQLNAITLAEIRGFYSDYLIEEAPRLYVESIGEAHQSDNQASVSSSADSGFITTGTPEEFRASL